MKSIHAFLINAIQRYLSLTILAFVVAIISFIPNSDAADWRVIGNRKDGKPVYVDYDSMNMQQGYLVIDSKFPPNANLVGFLSGIIEAYERVAISCSQNTAAVLSSSYAYKNGEVKVNFNNSINESVFNPIVSGTVISTKVTSLCRDYSLLQEAKESSPSKILTNGIHPSEWTDPLDIEDQKVYFKKESLEGDKDEIKFIARVESPSPKKTPIKNYSFINYVEISKIDCSNGEYYAVITEYFNEKNLVVERYEVNPENVTRTQLTSELGKKIKEISCGVYYANQTKSKRLQESQSEENEYSTGTAWQIDGKHLITAHHVVAGATRIVIAVSLTESKFVNVIASDPANDIAIIELLDGKLKSRPLQLASKLSTLGSKIAVVGYPLPDILGAKIQATSGEISGLGGVENDPRYYQISAAVQSGNSGGPVLNQSGEVVGVVSSKLNDITMLKERGLIPQNVNFAVKHPYVLALIDSAGIKMQKTPVKINKIEDAITQAQNSVYLVYVESKAQ